MTRLARRWRLSPCGAFALLAWGAAAAAQQFDELPEGALATTEQGLSSELVVYVTFDPAAHKDRLPDGLRFRTLQEYAARDPALTVWSPRAAAQTFELLTGYGNMNQSCEGAEWKAKGDHPFARAFLSRAQGGEEISGTSYQYGYVLRTALYRRRLTSE